MSNFFPTDPHSAIICGQTKSGKTVFALDLLEGPYCDIFEHIVIHCPSLKWNETYRSRPWIREDPEVYTVDPGDRLQDYLKGFYNLFQGEPTLYIVDDCSASKEQTKKTGYAILSGI
jgi:hypothetical protein